MNEQIMPDHRLERPFNVVGDYLKKTLVASCTACRGKDRKYRVTNIPRGTTICPDCYHGLFWERITTAEKNGQTHAEWLAEVKGNLDAQATETKQ